MLDMYDERRYEPLEASALFDDGASARPLVPGTVARGQLRDNEPFYVGKQDGKFIEELPLELTSEVLARGQERFNIYCSPCHGRLGDGRGMIVERGFRKPPSFIHTDRLLQEPVGHFYDVISNGFGAMPSYASRVTPEDRWKIVAYIRALQLSQNATVDDVPEELRGEIQPSGPTEAAEAERRRAAEARDRREQEKNRREVEKIQRSPEEGERRRRELQEEDGGDEERSTDEESDDSAGASSRGGRFKSSFDGENQALQSIGCPRPHPACLDGEGDWELASAAELLRDPIQLAWMVKEIVEAAQSYSPSRQAGWGLLARAAVLISSQSYSPIRTRRMGSYPARRIVSDSRAAPLLASLGGTR